MDTDRLSDLPEALIVHILSLLEMKNAVKTGILSQKWKFLWTQVDSIIYRFGYTYNPGLRVGRFMSFVDHTLMKCICQNIKSFSLCTFNHPFLNDEYEIEMVDKWLAYVMNKNKDSLKLKVKLLCYLVPECLYRYSVLTELELQYVDISILYTVNWPLLKRLSLSTMWVGDDCINNILLGCPVIETMVLDEVYGMSNLNIVPPSMKKLSLFCFHYQEGNDLKITAHWLKQLKICGACNVAQYELVDVTSLESASLRFIFTEYSQEDYYSPWINMVAGIFKKVAHVGKLIIDSDTIQALLVSQLSGVCPPLLKCKHVTITSPLRKFDVPKIAWLLQSTPHLETLVIDVNIWEFPHIDYLFPDGHPSSELQNKKFKNLKNVIITYNGGNSFADNPVNDFEFIGYILRNVVILEKLVICLGLHEISSSSMMSLLCSKLLTTSLVGNEAGDWALRRIRSNFEFRFLNYEHILLEE